MASVASTLAAAPVSLADRDASAEAPDTAPVIATAFGADAFVVDMPAAPASGHQAVAVQTPAQPIGRPETDTTAQPVQPGAALPATAPSSAGSIGGAVLALVLVVGLIVALGWFARRVPGIGGASHPGLKVLGSLSLGPRERVVVVAVGDTQLLLGTGATGTRVLHTLDIPLPMPEAKPTPVFAQVLAQQFGKKPS